MSQTGSPYTRPTGEGFLGSYAVASRPYLQAQIGAGVLRVIGAEPGDDVAVYPSADGAVIATTEREAAPIAELRVGQGGSVSLSEAVLDEHVGAVGGGRVRVYELEDGLLVVPDGDDPRVGGGEA